MSQIMQRDINLIRITKPHSPLKKLLPSMTPVLRALPLSWLLRGLQCNTNSRGLHPWSCGWLLQLYLALQHFSLREPKHSIDCSMAVSCHLCACFAAPGIRRQFLCMVMVSSRCTSTPQAMITTWRVARKPDTSNQYYIHDTRTFKIQDNDS